MLIILFGGKKGRGATLGADTGGRTAKMCGGYVIVLGVQPAHSALDVRFS